MLALATLAFAGFQITDLGTPPGVEKLEAAAINNRGEVAVRSISDSVGYAYLWRGGQFISLGEAAFLGGMGNPPSVRPNALNDRSAVVGASGGFGPVFHSGIDDKKAFVWNGTRMRLLFPENGIGGEAHDINSSGDIVGDYQEDGFVRIKGKFYSIGTLSRVRVGNWSVATAINDHRLILGTSTYGKGKPDQLLQRPFTADGNRHRFELRAAPLPKGYDDARGIALNERGTILAGASRRRKDGTLLYLVRSGKITPLILPGEPKRIFSGAVNARDEVVATCVDLDDYRLAAHTIPALWRRGKWVKLPEFPGWTLQSATGINDKGQICGTGLHDGKLRAFVMTPS